MAKAAREAAKAAKEAAAKAPKPDVAALEKKFMPLVKEGSALEEAGDLAGAMAKYKEAMGGFRGAGVKRPKLKEKMDACTAKISEPEPEDAEEC